MSPASKPAPASMAEQRRALLALVQRCLGDVPVHHALPGPVPSQGERRVGLYLLELAPGATPVRQPLRLQFDARFLVTTEAPDPSAAADDLADLAFAALDAADCECDLTPLPAATWQALGTPPRPAFTVAMSVRRDRAVVPAVPVRVAVLKLTQP